jgi:hypothetical protein
MTIKFVKVPFSMFHISDVQYVSSCAKMQNDCTYMYFVTGNIIIS